MTTRNRLAFVGSLLTALFAFAVLDVPARAQPDGQQPNGVTVGVNLHTATTLITDNNSQPLFSLGMLQGGFFAGYKIDRVMFGLGFDIARLASGMTTVDKGAGHTEESSTSNTAILILPGVRVAVLRSPDQTVELFAQLDVGWGHTFSDQTPPPNDSRDRSNNRLVYDVGPGVRYWVHPRFALSALVALRGDFLWQTETSTAPPQVAGNSQTLTIATTSIVGGLEFLGVF